MSITLDTAQRRDPVNPFIYSQFIEHLGRCIYGGIWAQMLEDRKFFYPVTDTYDPYRGAGGAFPVVAASPWKITGPAGSVTMTREHPFAADHAPRILPGSGIEQRDLGVVEGRPYVGYVWLRADNGANVEVTLHAGEQAQTVMLHRVENTYRKFTFQFTAGATADDARLTLTVHDGPVTVGAVSLMPADHVEGFRADTLALLRQLGAPMYRWPGGNFVSGYDWRDGIGDRDRRPPRKNPAWTGVEHNDVGLDEFLRLCELLDAEPMVAVNTGFGDAYSAAQEVEYCNGSAETIGGSWRRANGRAEPWGVRYWCVGNEMFGPWQLGFMRLSHYTLKHNDVARAMWKAAPSIRLVAVGNLDPVDKRYDPDEQRGWSRGMLEESREYMDYISEHFYRGDRFETPPRDVPTYARMLAASIAGKAEGHRALQRELGLSPDRLVPIAMDEWNYWHKGEAYGELGCVYRMKDAMGVAIGLHEYFRHTDIIHMAHYAQTVNVIGCIKTTRTSAFLDAPALPLIVYRHHFGVTPVAVSVEGGGNGIDVAAALTADGRSLTIGCVNPFDHAVTVRIAGIDAAGVADLWRIAHDDPEAHNTAESQPLRIVETPGVPFAGEVTLPAYSISVYRAPLN